MVEKHIPLDEARSRLAANERINNDARRATRWFPIFVGLQAVLAFAFTTAIDVVGVPYWSVAGILLLASSCLWITAFRHQLSAPRHGLRNMGIAVATWFVLYTWMLDPALQLVGASSVWWWVAAGLVSISPMTACFFPGSRQ